MKNAEAYKLTDFQVMNIQLDLGLERGTAMSPLSITNNDSWLEIPKTLCVDLFIQ